jgi:hypothetical protein
MTLESSTNMQRFISRTFSNLAATEGSKRVAC